ncbi:hypothetical protein COV93_06755 [Candidatus Woesearchaeota archaeon CG11_big_fil_rev_8_21_14_0_20_43_8]|nr:MAG: hypothetical protein COV93_06755 [Candidatus Woesearchaeota archaeon CG11_big_fil_rev_8_21_14_0_20_43_8]PIO04962.1 MAG: hypothetical protein COT47_06775 [Candidatus Woesearchaeota archaeon CG08_land_8_20_14_0_20_43_7]
MRAPRKGQIWLSAISYILITVVIIVLLLNTGIPLLEKVKDKSIFTKTKDMFLNIDSQIKDVQSEGAGAQRVIPIEIKKGDMTIQDNQIKWKMESKAKILEPRTKVFVGDLIIGDDSFITFEDGIQSFSEDFSTSTLSTNTWYRYDNCAGNDFIINGKYSATGGCRNLDDNYILSHKNITEKEDTTLRFTFNTGAVTTDDLVVVGWANSTLAVSSANIVAGIMLNYSGGYGTIQTYERGTTNWKANYTSNKDYNFMITKTTENGKTYTDFFMSENNKDWRLLLRNTTRARSESGLLKPFITTGGGIFTIDDIEMDDNTYHVNNTYLAMEFRKTVGTESIQQYINASDIIKKMNYTSTGMELTGKNFSFSINNDPVSSYGKGYVKLSELRTDPDAAVVIMHMNSSAAGNHYEYDLVMTLEGGVDFLLINIENLAINE